MSGVNSASRTVPVADGEIRLTWAEVTDRGRRRDTNQDAVLAHYPLFVVADGMGGHLGGEIASARTIERLRGIAEKCQVSPRTIEKALGKASLDISYDRGEIDEGTGTTVTGVYLDTSTDEPTWVTLNIGDSRVYLCRNGGLAQVTTDHSVVQDLIASGQLTPEEAESHPYSNIITRAVGPSEGAVPDYVRIDVVSGDRFVVCSDGLTKGLTDYGILHYLIENPDPHSAVEAMLGAALENGGRDNVTIIVLDVERDSSSPAAD